jgi:cobalt-zinc-cadmium efflux system outer membrane protein
MRRILTGSAALAALLTAGCATTNPRPTFVETQRALDGRADAPPEWARTPDEAAAIERIVDGHLARPLTAESAVAIALVNNPTLQATFEQAGVSQADLAQASRLENPELSGFVRFPSEGSGRNTELSLMLNVFDLLVRPIRKQVAAAEREQAKLRIAHDVLALAADVKEAYRTLQARQQLVARLGLIRELTATAGDFARRQHQAGTINDLELENRTVLDREARVDVARAQAEVRADRERLNRLLGLWGPRTAWTVESELPAIPAEEMAMEGLERHAVAQRQDLQAARWGVDLVGRALALRRKTRFLPVGLHVGINTEKEVTGERVTGPELALQLPLFDTGGASIARLQAEHRRAHRQLEALAVDARAEVREQRDRMLAARDLALFYERELLPQRARILDLTLRQYNAMFKGAYDLLLAKQAEVETEKARLDAWRDYWIARARLEKAVGGALPAANGTARDARPAGEGEGR